ncbi:tRNA uridine-5-carboxymethylaminomethyl(34) synthesis GTPase MnmE [Aureimonas leprariae]|uniref:tRNA modification GTPase MnmE n=1 Tax=Plantimonas leprariae TaxID=2615207 RepID=A0A7V7PNU8_9HYPH|nr:tRNA uridine-5-carboxymethylaminomethyl(34) synthesis GTPase MnmE [Aureimonas leprariae]KAB0679420.1 tRNA uridine-5-carboxymethylaminomethyl(34) synthesis GTPase MnmE [Aureimonas leprariae]
MRRPDTIAALSSGSLPSGVAVVRVSGTLARKALSRIAGSVPEARRASLRLLRDGEGTPLDRGLALFFEAPGTATGEDIAEFHLHGGRAVVAGVLEALTAISGIRLAEAGEFTRRAFENGTIDLTEAEGLADLLAAETAAQRAHALANAGGDLRALYEGWAARLVRARALLEASFDFADEGDVAADVAAPVRRIAAGLAEEMREHLAGARRGEILREGFRVAIVGAPNAGKSTLLNALAQREAAIVTDVPGTTRDVIEVMLDLGGFAVRLSDTAGLRETADPVERIGVERAKGAMAAADLVLELESPDALLPAELRDAARDVPRLRIRTKADVESGQETTPANISVSARTGEGMAALADRIATEAARAVPDPAALVPARARHREAVAAALRQLDEFAASAAPAEIGAELLRLAGDKLGRLTGRTDVEDLLDVIFSEFCIGK